MGSRAPEEAEPTGARPRFHRGPLDGRRRRLIPACQADREYVRQVEHLIDEARRQRSFGAKGFR